MFSATKFVVAGVIVALFGGFLLAGVLTQQQSEEPLPVGASASASPEVTSIQPFTLPAVIPDGIESGTLDTPAGPARWIHLTGDDETLPGRGRAIPWPSGVAFLEEGYRGRLLATSDGIEWQVEPRPLPFDAASLTFDDGVYWLISDTCTFGGDRCGAGTQLWRSSDGSTWDEIDLGGLGAFEPAPLGWTFGGLPAIGPPVTARDLTMSVATNGEADPYVRLGRPDCDGAPLSLGDGRYRMTGNEGACGPILRFEESDTGLRLIDDASDEELGEIPGADLTHLERMARREPFGIQRLLRIVDDEVVPVEVPWSQYDHTQLFGVDDQMYAYVLDIEGDNLARDVTVWRTSDGRSWSNLGPASFLDGAPLAGRDYYTKLTAVPGAMAAQPGWSGPEPSWETTDGTTWSALPEGPDGTWLHRLDSGWFASDGGAVAPVGDEWWMLIDDTWVSLAELGMERSKEWCTVRPTAVGNTTIFTFTANDMNNCDGTDDPPGTAEMWILSMDPTE